MLFKRQHIEPIRSGRKTQTRRLSLRVAVNPGNDFTATTARNKAGQFARCRCKRTWLESLGSITDADAWAEGYADRLDYLRAFDEINGPTPRDQGVRVYEFEYLHDLPIDEGA